MAQGKMNLYVANSRYLFFTLSLLAITISGCKAGAETEHKGKFLYCGPASPVMIDWLCRSIKHLESYGIKDGFIDPAVGYLPLTSQPPWKKRSVRSADQDVTDALDYLPDEATMIKRGIHAHVAMSLCCRRLCDARVFCRGY